MYKTERLEFNNELTNLFILYGKEEPDAQVVNAWWNLLCYYDLIKIKNAFLQWAAGNKYPPKGSDIIAILKAKEEKKEQPNANALREEIKRLDKEYGALLIEMAAIPKEKRDFTKLFELRAQLAALEIQLL